MHNLEDVTEDQYLYWEFCFCW